MVWMKFEFDDFSVSHALYKGILLLRENSLCKIGSKYILSTSEIKCSVISTKYALVHHCVHSPVASLLILKILGVS